MELGGKCPVIVDETANLEAAMYRILFAKFANCGQTCVGVDHVFVHESLRAKFKKMLLEKLDETYGNDPEGSMGTIINDFHVKRL